MPQGFFSVSVAPARRVTALGLTAAVCLALSALLTACEPTGSSYTMDHTALTHLLDRNGQIRVELRHEQTAVGYTADLQKLLAEKPG